MVPPVLIRACGRIAGCECFPDVHGWPAQRWLPLGALGTSALIGAIFCVLLTLGFAWLAKGVFSDRFVAIDDGVITHVFYPVFPPDKSAEDVIAWLQASK